MKNFLSYLAICAITSGCTTITVNHADQAAVQSIKHICIESNPKVIVPSFESILQSSFVRHGITSQIYEQGRKPESCSYTLKYSATRSWDFVTYMTDADLNLQSSDKTISVAKFHLKGKGGFDLSKWRSTESKINDLVDQLLNNK